jgi:phosphoribosylformylglycinamidine synthase subunit PurQ / glutaminase
MKAAVIVFPGSNCDRDMKVALSKSMGKDPEMIWHGNTELPPLDLIAIPGGFSYGDYLRCGAMAANSPIMREVIKRAEAGTPVIAVCNGFQICTETGMLPGALLRNANQKFICKDVHLRVERENTCFTREYGKDQVIRIPVAHHDGNYYNDDDSLKALNDNDQVAFRYSTENGDVTNEANINGSLENIAGIFNSRGNILGMMPHPERLIEPALGGADGRPLFDSLINSLN